MKLLAIEAATETCSAALLIGDEVLGRDKIEPRGHARLILPMIDSLLSEAGIDRSELEAIAFGRGPGSFTGLRIAAGIAQGIAFACDLPVAPVSTLAALAQKAIELNHQTHVLAAIDARMDEVYWGAYVRDARGLARLQGEEHVCPPQAAPLPQENKWHGAGSGWYAHAEALRARLGDRVLSFNGELSPGAEQIARLGEAAVQAGLTVPAEQALPVYLRDRVAKKAAV